MPTLTQRGYARHRRAQGLNGGTLQAVRKALAGGRIQATEAGLIDPVEADRSWRATTVPHTFATRPGRPRAAAVRPGGSSWAPTAAQSKRWQTCRAELHRLHDVLGDDVDDVRPAGHLIGDGPRRLDALCIAYNAVIDAVHGLDEALQQYGFAAAAGRGASPQPDEEGEA